MSFEDFRASQKEEQNKEREDQETPPEYTLKSILNNKERSDLLAGEIEKNGDTDLVNRLVNKQLTETDLGKLGDYREQFVEKLKQVEKIKESISPEVLEDITDNSPELKEIANLVGSGGVKNILFKNFESLAFKDTSHFDQINKAVEKVAKHKETIEKKEEHIKELSKKYNVSEDKLYEALKIKDDNERREAIKAVVKDKMGFWKKMAFGATFVTANRIEALDQREQLDKLSDDLDKRLKGVGSFLAMTINENDEVRQALQAEVLEEKETSKEDIISFKEGRDAWRVFEEKTQKDIENDFKDFILKEKKIKNYDTFSDPQKDLLTNEFFNKKKQKLVGKKGFWASLFGNLFEVKKKNIDVNKLKTIA